MTGFDRTGSGAAGSAGRRVYLDWNASAPLRPEARAAMLAAMDQLGNPASVHAEGRAARAIVEHARARVARLVGCAPEGVVFTSGASEANALALASCAAAFHGATEHESVVEPATAGGARGGSVPVTGDGRIDRAWLLSVGNDQALPGGPAVLAVAAANSETGVLEDVAELFARARGRGLAGHCDATQAVGRLPFSFAATGAGSAAVSAHKLGGPKGVGAWIHDGAGEPRPLIRGGGQESGWRSGTENVIGIAGFGAAAEAARRELEEGAWERVARLRDALEARLETAAPDLILFGKGAPRLPNTSCFAVPGWAGETQVMQMDLAGFAVSAGSACSSGKVKKASRVLCAMGFDEMTASSAIRVSMGPGTTEAEVMAFADAWIDRAGRRSSRAA